MILLSKTWPVRSVTVSLNFLSVLQPTYTVRCGIVINWLFVSLDTIVQYILYQFLQQFKTLAYLNQEIKITPLKAMGKEIETWDRPKPTEYSRLPLEDDHEGHVRHAKPHPPLRRRAALMILCVIFGAIAGAFLIFLAKILMPQPKILTCGVTSEEARARGCVMEPMVYGWVPKECYYADLSSEYNPYEDREWYTTPAFEELVTPEELWAGKRSHVYTHKYHTEHCFFLMRKLSRAVNRREKYVDHKSLQLEHVDHCAEIITGRTEAPNSTNDVVLGFYKCIPLSWA